jgi:hypothetical protein
MREELRYKGPRGGARFTHGSSKLASYEYANTFHVRRNYKQALLGKIFIAKRSRETDHTRS